MYTYAFRQDRQGDLCGLHQVPWKRHGHVSATKQRVEPHKRTNKQTNTDRAGAGPKTQRHALDGWWSALCIHTDQKVKTGAHTTHLTARTSVTDTRKVTKQGATNHKEKQVRRRSVNTQTHAGWASVNAMCSHRPERKEGGPYDSHDSPHKCHENIYVTKNVPQTMHIKNTRPVQVRKHTDTGWRGGSRCLTFT